LDGDDDSRDSGRVLARCPEEALQGVGGALAQLAEEPPILADVHPEHLGNREDILAVGDGGQDLVGHPGAELKHPLLVAGRAEVSPLAGERQQVLVPARVAAHPGQPLRQIPAAEKLLDHAADEEIGATPFLPLTPTVGAQDTPREFRGTA